MGVNAMQANLNLQIGDRDHTFSDGLAELLLQPGIDLLPRERGTVVAKAALRQSDTVAALTEEI